MCVWSGWTSGGIARCQALCRPIASSQPALGKKLSGRAARALTRRLRLRLQPPQPLQHRGHGLHTLCAALGGLRSGRADTGGCASVQAASAQAQAAARMQPHRNFQSAQPEERGKDAAIVCSCRNGPSYTRSSGRGAGPPLCRMPCLHDLAKHPQLFFAHSPRRRCVVGSLLCRPAKLSPALVPAAAMQGTGACAAAAALRPAAVQ